MAILATTDIYGDLRIKGEVKSDEDIIEKGQKLEDKYVDSDSGVLFASGGPVEDVPPQTTVVDADTLGGRPAADYVKSSQVLTNVPSGAIFTDTIVDISGKADIVDLNTKADKEEVYVKADKTYVDSKVKTDVPVGALFTDTIATKESIGLTHVTNTKQMPMTGGTFTGVVKAKSNNDLANAQLRNVIFSTENPEDEDGEDGDIWFVYSEVVK